MVFEKLSEKKQNSQTRMASDRSAVILTENPESRAEDNPGEAIFWSGARTDRGE